MSSITRWHKRTEKVSSDSEWLRFDLMSALTYMSVLASGGISQDLLMERVISQRFRSGVYFQRVYALCSQFGFEYTRALEVVSQWAKAQNVRNLLLRFARSLVSGQPDSVFLAQEAKSESQIYASHYQGKLESLQKWSDAYAALLVSSAVITVIILVTTMLFPFSDLFVVMLCSTVVTVGSLGVYIIYKSAPHEVKTYRSGRGPAQRLWATRILLVSLPAAVALGLALALQFGPGAFSLLVGVGLFPAGLLALLDDRRITRIDDELASFFRALGNVTSSVGTTTAIALRHLDHRSLGILGGYVGRLELRLDSGLDPDTCWERFRDETGSEMASRTSRMFVDGVTSGGEPEEVGKATSDYAQGVSLLRAQRQITSSSFAYVLIPLHGAMVALLVFILEVIENFNSRLNQILTSTEALSAESSAALSAPDLQFFQAKDMTLMGIVVLLVVGSITVTNSLAPKFATGGSPMKAVAYGALMFAVSGVTLLVTPPMVGKLLV